MRFPLFLEGAIQEQEKGEGDCTSCCLPFLNFKLCLVSSVTLLPSGHPCILSVPSTLSLQINEMSKKSRSTGWQLSHVKALS